METDPKKSASRFAKHLQIMGIEKSEISEPALTAEKSAIDSLNLPPLDLARKVIPVNLPSSERFSINRWAGIASALAALVAIVIFMPQPEDGFRVKGAVKSRVFVEKNGQVNEWDRESPLLEGSKVRVEVKALTDVVSFIGVVDRGGSDLFPVDQVWGEKVGIALGEVMLSPGSIEIFGENEGETIISISCPKEQAPLDFAGFLVLWRKSVKELKTSSVDSFEVAPCTVESIKLR